jgi:hypothetical protein
MYNNSYNNSGFADSGYLSRTPTPPTPSCIPSPQLITSREEVDENGILIQVPRTIVLPICCRTGDKTLGEIVGGNETTLALRKTHSHSVHASTSKMTAMMNSMS